MEINQNGFYIIDDQFFIDFPDDYLKGNHTENRPHYFCLKEEKTGLLWVIPLSHRVEKYKAIMDRKIIARKPCDIIHILEIAGSESVFLIQDMFPITVDYIKREYTINEIPLKLLDRHHIETINRKAKKILTLIRRGISFNPTQPNVLEIEQKLLEKIGA